MINLTLISYEVPQVQALRLPDGTVSDDIVQLLAPCRYHFRIDSTDYILTVYPPFRFEASIPWGFRWMLGDPCDNRNLCYALPHDALYSTHLLDKAIADKLLDEISEKVGKSGLVSSLTYRGVKWFGGRAWLEGGNLSPEKVKEICTLEVMP